MQKYILFLSRKDTKFAGFRTLSVELQSIEKYEGDVSSMAKIFPSELESQPSFHRSQGEREVYRALTSLNDNYTIFYSFRWLNTNGQQRSEGEGDFVVLHPEYGILSIEVKDGGIDYEDSTWWQTNRRTGERKRIDPFNQAAATQYRL